MQTAFIYSMLQANTSKIGAILRSAPGFISSKYLQDKNGNLELNIFFCRLEDGFFDDFKKFVLAKIENTSPITIQEGVKL